MKTNLMLLAGRGQRFADADYTVPKPFIEVDGQPMVIAAARHLPPADKLVFVIYGDDIKDYSVHDLLKKHFPEAKIVTQTTPLLGQAHSALLAEGEIDPGSELTIASCDAGLIYNTEQLQKAISDPNTDALIWAFRNYPPMEINPNAYGWIKVDQNNYVEKVQYKIPLSDHPLNDYAVVGWFSYKTAKICFDNIKEMVAKNLKSGAEFSLDECTNVLIKNGLKVKTFEIDTFKSWGTPNELRTYQYWQNYFSLRKQKNNERAI